MDHDTGHEILQDLHNGAAEGESNGNEEDRTDGRNPDGIESNESIGAAADGGPARASCLFPVGNITLRNPFILRPFPVLIADSLECIYPIVCLPVSSEQQMLLTWDANGWRI